MKKVKNAKGFYKDGRLTLKDVRNEPVLFVQVQVRDRSFIDYIRTLDRETGGSISAKNVVSALAIRAFREGIRLETEVKR